MFQDLGTIRTDPTGSAHRSGDDHTAKTFNFNRFDMRENLGITVISTRSSPALISEVDPGSLAAGRLQPGDRIITVNGEPVKGAKKVAALIASARRLEILVERSTYCSELARGMSAKSKGSR
jgi:S1-C subfamily serine protease